MTEAVMNQRSLAPRLLVLVIVSTLATAARANAQPATPDPVTGPTQMVSANPFTLMFKWFNADYERRLNGNATWGAGGSFFSIDDFDYTNVNATCRYYPRRAMDGFYLGARTGVYHISAVDSANFYGAGFELGYSWLLGRRENVVIGIGAGVTRLFGGTLAGASLAVPTLRLVNVGFTF